MRPRRARAAARELGSVRDHCPVDEDVAEEIREMRVRIGQLKGAEGPPEVIAEYETELRVLEALARAADVTAAAVAQRPELAEALLVRGFAGTSYQELYAFVYERALDLDLEGRDFASLIAATDFTRYLENGEAD